MSKELDRFVLEELFVTSTLRNLTIAAGVTALTALIAIASMTPSASASSADDKKYDLQMSVSKSLLKKGEEGTVTITISPREGFELKTATPFKALLVGSQTLELSRTTFNNKDFADPKAAAKSVQSSFIPAQTGQQSISADLTFFICNDELCERLKDQAKVDFNVK